MLVLVVTDKYTMDTFSLLIVDFQARLETDFFRGTLLILLIRI